MNAPHAALLEAWNGQFASSPPEEIIHWALQRVNGPAVISTNFRPFEVVVLHLVTRLAPGIPVLWVDHGYNRPATYRHAAEVCRELKLNLHAYVPRITAAHRDALHGPLPPIDDEEGMRKFSQLMKLEPFQRGMRALGPRLWFTGLRRAHGAERSAVRPVEWDSTFATLKINPVAGWDDEKMEAYRAAHGLPHETDYFDPAKGDAKRECGLHASWAKASP